MGSLTRQALLLGSLQALHRIYVCLKCVSRYYIEQSLAQDCSGDLALRMTTKAAYRLQRDGLEIKMRNEIAMPILGH